MATRKFQLNEEARDELKRAERATKRSSELRRMQAVRLYGSGQAMPQIVEVTRMGTRNILHCVARYREKGMQGLYEYQQTGNRTLLTDAQRRDLAEKLHQYRPTDLHISQRQYWTVSDVAVAVEQWYGVVYKHTGSYVRILHRSGFTFQRSSKVYRHKPSPVALAEFEAQLEKK
jgi:transposase